MRHVLTAVAVAAALLTTACTATDDASLSPGADLTTSPTAAAAHVPTNDADAADDSAPPALTAGLTEFFDAGSSADDAVQRLRAEGRDAEASLIERIAEQPIGQWLGDWTPDVTGTVRATTEQAASAGQIALFVVYNVPGRDCGLYSAGGAPADAYLGWVQHVADGVAPGAVAWFVLEPDALAQWGDCDGQGDRIGLLSEAARILDDAGGHVFIDVGNSNWKTPETMAERIALVGTEHLAGFATNTSNYYSTDRERAWGERLTDLTGLPFVTDTSRNGNGAPDDGAWCNPRGRAIGEAPRVVDPDGPLIATIWAKAPGESDGTCNGGPAAGQWWEDVALELAGGAN